MRPSLERLLDTSEALPPADADALLEQAAAWSRRTEWLDRWNSAARRITAIQEALIRAGHAGALGEIHARVDKVLRSARAVLAQVGISDMAEIGRFEPEVVAIEQAFMLTGREREDAYCRTANSLFAQVSRVVDLSLAPLYPPYDPSDDAASFDRLVQVVSLRVSRALPLLTLRLPGEPESREAKLRLGKLVADVKALARRVAEPDRLIMGTPPRMRTDTVTAIQAIQQRIASESPGSARAEAGHDIKARLAALLSASPSLSTDFQELVANLPPTLGLTALLLELARLQASGLVRIVIGVPTSSMEDQT